MDNKLIHGDATRELQSLTDDSIDLVVTDAPYLCQYRDRHGRTIANDDSPEFVLSVFPEMYRVMKRDSYCILFCGWSAIPSFSAAWERAGFRTSGQIVWAKPYTSSARHVQYRHESAWVLTKGNPTPPPKPLPDVQEWTYSGNRRHPTEKAVEIIRPLIQSFSKPGDLVLDPFLGSGTTAVAAALCRRRAIGIEIESRYCTVAARRLDGVRRYQQSRHDSASVGNPNDQRRAA